MYLTAGNGLGLTHFDFNFVMGREEGDKKAEVDRTYDPLYSKKRLYEETYGLWFR